MNKDWWQKSTVYQVYPMSYKDSDNDGYGDIGGIIEKLPYLKDLGIEIIWLNPIYESPMRDNGYDIADYYNINPLFGTMKQFEELLSKAHDLGLKIIMDLVVNHCSSEHEWFKDAISNLQSKYKDYFYFSDTKVNDQTGAFSEECWTYNETIGKYYFHIFAIEQPDLNWSNKEMRFEIYKMINYWLDKGIDGFRLDVIDCVGKDPYNKEFTSPLAHTYINEMYNECFKGRNVFTVGETGGATVEEAILYSSPAREELSMVFGFDQLYLDQKEGGRWDIAPLKLTDLKKVFTKWQKGLEKDGWNSIYWSNHDQPRIVSRFGNDTKYRELSAKMLAILLHGLKGTPYVYQGEEIGMTNIKLEISELKDIESINVIEEKRKLNWSQEKIMKGIHAKGRDNARTPMQWNNTDNAGFTQPNIKTWLKVNENYKSINVEDALLDKDSIYYTYQNLIKLRKEMDIIVHGTYDILLAESEDVYAYKRTYKNQTLYVIANFYEKEVSIQLDFELNEYQILEHNYNDFEIKNNEINLRSYEAIMILIK